MKNERKRKLMMIPVAALAAAVMLSGCGGSGESGGTKPDEAMPEAAASAESVGAVFDRVAASGLAPLLDTRAELGSDTFDKACDKLYGLTAGELAEGGIFFVGAGTSADEISVLLPADASVNAEELLKKRAETRAADFGGYAPGESEKAKNAQVFTCGKYTVMVIADDPEAVKEKILG